MKKLLLLLLCLPMIGFGQNISNFKTFDLGINIVGGWDDVVPLFTPIGWSKNGKFAYHNAMCDDMCGCCTNELIIFNSILDENIEYLDFVEIEGDADIENVFTKDSIEIKNILTQNNIVYGNMGQFIKSSKIDDYNIVLDQKKVLDKYDDEWDLKNSFDLEYKLMVGNNNIGYKTVSQDVINDNFQRLQYLGYIKSPFENRILILFSNCNLGIENTYTYSLYIFGCNLNLKTF